MKKIALPLVVLPLLAGTAWAGDPAVGEGDFKKCKACHAIVADDGTAIVKGGKTGPNLFGVIGRQIGAAPDFNYGDSLVAAGADGTVWDEANLAAYITDPKAWLAEVTGDAGAKTKMTYKHRSGAEDMAAYLASLNQ
ncbi:c-type cytochrome [Actibacterium sp. XHP0104]|uniref:c-type cytochrome n=1 Tax=Actibacterium sp. XHP0104 TaxID=2984335 RepID=UPI0021E93877|nr:cytochrome C [Actibacterium sp. XHP0104]MCV2881265.1 cytochrome C [Actibacterium sp. XHP0104]